MEISRFNSIEAIADIKELMQSGGCWPPSDSPLKTKIMGIICVVTLIAFSVTTLIKVFSDITNFEDVSFGMVCALAGLSCLTKYAVVFLNEKSFLNVLEHLKNPYFTSHRSDFDIYLWNNIKTSRRIRGVLRASGVGLFIIIAGSPFLTPLEERPLPIPFAVDVKVQSLAIYLLALCIQVVACAIVAYTIPCYDSFLFSLMVIAAGQLQVLQQKIIEVVDEINNNTLNQYWENWSNSRNNMLKQCVEHHITIEKFITLMEDTFMWSFLVQVMVSLLITCFIGFNLVLIPLLSLQFTRTALFFLAVMIELSMFCIPGNELILESEKIRDACYISNWNNCGTHTQKLLFLIMERAKRPFILTAAKFVPLSLPTLLSVMRSSFSYFMVLRQMYQDAGESK